MDPDVADEYFAGRSSSAETLRFSSSSRDIFLLRSSFDLWQSASAMREDVLASTTRIARSTSEITPDNLVRAGGGGGGGGVTAEPVANDAVESLEAEILPEFSLKVQFASRDVEEEYEERSCAISDEDEEDVPGESAASDDASIFFATDVP